MKPGTTAFVHYTAPPVVGGVEIVMHAHAQVFTRFGYPVTMVAGRGDQEAMPPGVDFVQIPEMDTRHPDILEIGPVLEAGQVPPNFRALTDRLEERLRPILVDFENVIIHNVFGKHFNLPLTAALFRLIDRDELNNPIYWGHDFTWTSQHSRSKVHPGYPWDLLRRDDPRLTYVVVSEKRQQELASLLERPLQDVHVVYNGVDPVDLLGLTPEGEALIERLDLWNQDLLLLMPVRVTQAKNIEFAQEIVAALKAAGCKVRLILTGPPDPHDEASMGYFHQLQERRRKLGIVHEMRFVFESGPSDQEGYTIDMEVVGDLFRVCDVMLMTSHREGFGMPVLEAGLAGMAVASTSIPAAAEIGGPDLIEISVDDPPKDVARRILAWAENDPRHRLRSKVRKKYTWKAIFERDIEPLLAK